MQLSQNKTVIFNAYAHNVIGSRKSEVLFTLGLTRAESDPDTSPKSESIHARLGG